jgi:acyl-CoA ligase (AMP-forming) (exosortase A-associated)
MNYLVQHLLNDSVLERPDKEALVHGEVRLSYREIEEKTNRLANALLEMGLKRGQRVGIFLEKNPNEAMAIFAIAKAGGVFVPINHLLYPDQVRHIIKDCAVSALVTSPKKLAAIREIVAQETSIQTVILEGGDSPPADAWDFGRKVSVASLEDIHAKKSALRPVVASISRDLAAILYTSGSTGKPKGVMLSHANLVAGARIVASPSYLGIGERDRILSILPFSFDYGLNQLLTAFQQGATLVLLTFQFPDEIVQALIKERITGLAGVPPLWCVLTQTRSSFHRQKFPDLRYITNSGGAMPLEVLRALRKVLTDTSVFLMYGLTEAFRSTFLPPDQLDRRPSSMGKAMPDTEILVLDEQGAPCRPGEAGELVHRGPTVSMGYWGQPEATNKVLRPNPCLPQEVTTQELVCYSGDLVKTDEEGFLYFVGRRDTMIKSSGFRISPTEVEEVLYASGKLAAAAVVGVPDAVLGESIKAFVVPKGGSDLDVEGLLTSCADKMPRYMIPREVQILEQLPKTSSGKVDYQSLRRGCKS